jgi:hypothetical protein
MRTQHRLAAVGLAASAMAAAVLAAGPASAGQLKSHIEVTPGGPFALSSPGALTQIVTVGLDSGCPTALGTGNDFSIAASTDNSAVATVAPASFGPLQCGETHNFTITAVGDGGATIHFDAVTKPGLQKQTAGGSANVTVTGFGTPNPPPNPGGHSRPAAPAVTNAYLKVDGAEADTCKAAYGGGHNWHGRLMKDVAKWAATNHLGKAKNDETRFTTDNDWINYVKAEVQSLCSQQH